MKQVKATDQNDGRMVGSLESQGCLEENQLRAHGSEETM